MTTLPARQQDFRYWLPRIAAFALVALILLIVVSGKVGTDVPARTSSAAGPIGSPATVTDVVPAYIQEGIVFGEIDPADVTPTAEIMPVYMVERSYFEE